MGRRCSVEFEPLGRRIRVEAGETLLHAAQAAGVGLNAVCGGTGRCGTCRVRVVEGKVSRPTEAETDHVAEGYRLACQAEVEGNLLVDVPPESVAGPQRAQIEGRERSVPVDPMARVCDVRVPLPTLEDLRSDGTRLLDALREQHGTHAKRLDGNAAKRLPAAVRAENGLVRPALLGDEVIAFLPPGASPLGLAVDMGTTKLAAYLLDLETGETLGATGRMNPQIAYGEDVMARITYALRGPDEAKRLQDGVLAGIAQLAEELCLLCGQETTAILEVVLAGNTCMHHLALGLPVEQLGLSPYVPALSDPLSVKARDLGWDMAPGAGACFLPNIAGFVGGDHVAMLLATAIRDTGEVTVGLDIGTNTEISLAAGGELWCCSCASGPAFEGAHIQDGMRAAPGAVERVGLVEAVPGEAWRVDVQTVGDVAPVGICGSGVLDAVAALRRAGVLRKTGAFVPGSHPRLRGAGKDAAFALVLPGEQEAARDISITRKDVNEIQLAKAAIRAGIEELLLEAGVAADRIERVVVVGAFGTYLDVESALAVGMFPPLPPERFVQLGNAAGTGARMALLSRGCREEAETLARRVRYVELTTVPHFVSSYTEALMLP
jgi:uncharacterized 2Fe-2S/4Fe-4S cluster protein (DUF4445 family)